MFMLFVTVITFVAFIGQSSQPQSDGLLFPPCGIDIDFGAQDEAGQVIVGIDTDALFAEAGLSARDNECHQSISRHGVSYYKPSSFSPGSDFKIYEVMIGVHIDKASTLRSVDTLVYNNSVGPSNPGSVDGGPLRWWLGKSQTDGRTIWRVNNVQFAILWRGTRSQAEAFAALIDEIVRTNPQIAPRGPFQQMPRIVRFGLPAEAVTGDTIPLSPVIEVFDTPSLLRTIDSQGRSHASRLIMECAPFTSAGLLSVDNDQLYLKMYNYSGELPLNLIAVNEQNVIIMKSETIRLLPKPEDDSENKLP